MSKLGLALLFVVLAPSVVVEAADRVRMGFPDLAAQFLAPALGGKKRFSQRTRLTGRIHSHQTGNFSGGAGQRRNRL